MGSGASRSTSSPSSHHQDNEKNRLNPTEKVEKWKEKMLLDIGSDPLSVIRDFPRMSLFFISSEEEKLKLIKEQAYMKYVADDHAEARDGKDEEEEGEVRLHVADVKQKKKDTKPPKPSTASRYAANPSNPLTPKGNPIHKTNHSNDLDADGRLFAARRRRLKANVLAIAELVGEANTFGRWFSEAWEEKELGHLSSCRENSHSSGQGPDIHQIFQAACLECGMLNVIPDADSSTFSELSNVANNRRSRQVSRMTSSLFASAASPLLAGGNTVPAAAASAETVANSNNNNSSSAKSKYAVASSTFHVMQFIVQGVMFFPFQRLKHILWFPWAPTSLYSDCDWKVFVYLQKNVKSLPGFIYEKKVEHSAHKRGLDNANAGGGGGDSSLSVGVAAAAGGGGGPYNSTSNRSDTSQSRNNKHKSKKKGNAEEYPTETAPLLSRDGSRNTFVSGNEHRTPREDLFANDGNDSSPKTLLVIKHLQVVQHFVEERDRKTVPKYQLDWTCTIYLERDKVQETYRPFLPRQRHRWAQRLRGSGKSVVDDEDVDSYPDPRGKGTTHQEDDTPSLFRGERAEDANRREEDHAPFAQDNDGASHQQSPEQQKANQHKDARKDTKKKTKSNSQSKEPGVTSIDNGGSSSSGQAYPLSGKPPTHGSAGNVIPKASPSTSPALPSLAEGSTAHGSNAHPNNNSNAISATSLSLVVGVKAAQQAALVAREAVYANMDVVGARVELAKKGICGVPSTWAKHTDELRFVLEEQYRLELEEVKELKKPHY